MARSRNIKPAFFSNEDLADNSPLGRVLFIGLWTIADYKGNLEWRPKRIGAQLLPYDKADIKKLALELDKTGFVRFYSDGVKIYLHIANFSKHQNPHPNERKKGSDIPEYSECYRQLIDLQGLTINHDKSRQVSEDSITDPADSLIPLPDSPNPLPEEAEEVIVSFHEFWKVWPKKVEKAKAEPIWERLKVTEKLFEEIKAHCTTAYVHTEKQYIPNPTTYLNGKRWEDEIIDQPQQLKLPADDKLESFAREHGLSAPGLTETYFDYRKKLERELRERTHG